MQFLLRYPVIPAFVAEVAHSQCSSVRLKNSRPLSHASIGGSFVAIRERKSSDLRYIHSSPFVLSCIIVTPFATKSSEIDLKLVDAVRPHL